MLHTSDRETLVFGGQGDWVLEFVQEQSLWLASTSFSPYLPSIPHLNLGLVDPLLPCQKVVSKREGPVVEARSLMVPKSRTSWLQQNIVRAHPPQLTLPSISTFLSHPDRTTLLSLSRNPHPASPVYLIPHRPRLRSYTGPMQRNTVNPRLHRPCRLA